MHDEDNDGGFPGESPARRRRLAARAPWHGRYPENELWDAVEGYLDLLDASRGRRSDT
jgi:hypothetical protein